MEHPDRFGHREHVQLAFTAIRAHGMPVAIDHVCDYILQLAAYQRVPAKYHYTMSRAWVEIVAYHDTDASAGFGELIANNPELLDKKLLARHYRNTTLSGEQARTGWVEPDLAPFPWRSPR